MIPWWWVLIAFIGGEIAGIVIFRFLTMNDEPKSKYIRKG